MGQKSIQIFKETVLEEFDVKESMHEGLNKGTNESFFFTVDKNKYPNAPEKVKEIVEQVNGDIELIQNMEGEDEYFFTVFYGVKGSIESRSGGRNPLALPPKLPKNFFKN